MCSNQHFAQTLQTQVMEKISPFYKFASYVAVIPIGGVEKSSIMIKNSIKIILIKLYPIGIFSRLKATIA